MQQERRLMSSAVLIRPLGRTRHCLCSIIGRCRVTMLSESSNLTKSNPNKSNPALKTIINYLHEQVSPALSR